MKLTEEQTEKHVDDIRENGYAVVENAIEPELVDDLRAALDRMEEEQGRGYSKTSFEGKKTLRFYNLLAYDPVFRQIPIHENTLPIAEGVLDKGVLLSSISGITIGPGEKAQPLHGDSQMIPLPRPHVTIALNCMWCLVDYTEANGATRIVPGSHKNDTNPDYKKEYKTVAAEAPAGSVIFFDSQLWHGGGANVTEERRYGIANYYCAGWVRQQENQILGIPSDLAKEFPRRLQELCGYSVYKGMYGHIENHDPIEYLGRERIGKMVWQATEDRA
ncbi:MAG: phytanoyl-CoA dioxygenase family protein [Candidatus Hydrogenedentes bacterium]|nr:phytanoyl-CoA dioxygenase family protein [Candidatus Hydrogenedentota bacterium]